MNVMGKKDGSAGYYGTTSSSNKSKTSQRNGRGGGVRSSTKAVGADLGGNDSDGDGDGDEDGFLGWDHDKLRRRRQLASDRCHSDDEDEEDGDGDGDGPDGDGRSEHDLSSDEGNSSNGYGRDSDLESGSESESQSESESDSELDSLDDNSWSISIRLNSVVDLPSSILPDVPLCPILKFALLEISDPQQLREVERISAAVRRAEYEQTKDEQLRSKVLPQTSIIMKNDGVLKDFQTHLSLVHCAERLSVQHADGKGKGNGHGHGKGKGDEEGKAKDKDGSNSNPNGNMTMMVPALLDPKSTAVVKQSSGKIVSKRDNGMMEWHEEMRWDGIQNPLQMVLAVELSTRAVPVPVSSSYPTSPSSPHKGGLGLGPLMSSSTGRPHRTPSSSATTMTTNTNTTTGAPSSSSVDYEDRYEQVMMRYSQERSSPYPSAPNSITTTNTDTNTYVSYSHPNNTADRDRNGITRTNGSGNGNEHTDANGNTNTNANGILGLWRRGKQNLVERRKRTNVNANSPASTPTSNANATPTPTPDAIKSGNHNYDSKKAGEVANQAAVLAKHLVNEGFNHDGLQAPMHNDDHDLHTRTTFSIQDHDPYHDKLGSEIGTVSSVSGSLSLTSPAVTSTSTASTGDEYGDLRLGTLLVPLANLPLEETIPRVEKWYQFDTLGNSSQTRNATNNGQHFVEEGGRHMSKAGKAAATAGDTSSTVSGTGSGTDSNNIAPWRDPTVLLDISMCTSTTLDQLEDEAYNSLGGGDSFNAMAGKGTGNGNDTDKSGQPTRQRFLSDLSVISLQPESKSPHDSTTPEVPSHHKGKQGMNSDISVIMEEKTARLKQEELERFKHNGPYLEPGIVDYVCVVGAKNIGDLKDDDSKRGWVKSAPECCVLEQFPSNEFHQSNGRSCVLPEGIEAWCFPEGCHLWRGSEPPSHMDMNLKRFSASSPPRMASSIAAFDACLNCTTSFMWWVLSSNSDQYGSSTTKTYGAVIRFYAEVPDQSNSTESGGDKESNKMWCPLGICLTSSLPIVGILEAVLLRLCEKLASGGLSMLEKPSPIFHRDIMNLILNYHKPIPGVVNCSIPFLSGDGDRLHVSLPPKTGIPALPHGVSVVSVCRLLGAEGLTALLAAILTESKILVHSADVANLAMVGEVITALMYPFQWLHPFIPVLPLSMMTIVEAPVSYFLGVPSCNMKMIDKRMLGDVVVVDLDNGFSASNYFDGGRSADASIPTPLPATVSSNISKAIFRLLREEEEVQEQYGSNHFSDSRHLPRLETESLAERDFRVTVAHQICGMIRGYQECLFFVSACTPVFNRDRFLRQAPALFEERRPTISSMSAPSPSTSMAVTSSPVTRIISPRSKRFLSGLVNSQHFYALLEKLDSEENTFFHEIMDTFGQNDGDSLPCNYGSSKQRSTIEQLRNKLERIEQKLPTYHVHHRQGSDLDEEFDLSYDFVGGYFTSFTSKMLKPVKPEKPVKGSNIKGTNEFQAPSYSSVASKPKALSLQDLVELDKRQWIYCKLFDIDLNKTKQPGSSIIWKKIHLKEALGERKFSVWKDEQELKYKHGTEVEDVSGQGTNSAARKPLQSSLDLTKLISNVRSDEIDNRKIYSKLKWGSVGDQSVIKRYIERAYEIVEENQEGNYSLDNDHVVKQFSDINAEVDAAMKNSSAQRFLISVLSQRSRLQNENRMIDNNTSFRSLRPGYNMEVSTSNLHPLVFDCLYRLCNSMLDACHAEYDYEAAYRLLIHTTGFCKVYMNVVSYMTKRIANHPIYNDLRLWDRVLLIHMDDRQRDKVGNDARASNSETNESDEYEATVSTLYEMLGYGMPADDLARFASRVTEDKFYSTDKEQKLLMLARRLAVKCDESTFYGDLIKDPNETKGIEAISEATAMTGGSTYWKDVKWTHPGVSSLGGQTPITKLASFGNSIVATGGLDGSIYLASTMHLDTGKRGKIANQFVRGTKLEWPQNSQVGSYEDGAPGAVSCLATTEGSQGSKRLEHSSPISGCRLVCGSTGGNLAVWNIANTLEGILGEEPFPDGVDGASQALSDMKLHSGGTQSAHVRNTSSPSSRSKRYNRTRTGKSLGSHRGGVTCLSIPPKIYRPDSLISAGNDGLIKFWSLREDTNHSRNMKNRRATMGASTSRLIFSSKSEKGSGKDTLDVLAGHGGRILCVETAWHGDRILSGAADRTVKLWDLASQSGGRCLQTMHGHSAWVTHCRYWGRNTIISASSDRSIALWDTRSGSSPENVLRYHNGPISDLYLESRTSFWMASAGADGTVATWDFRMMKNLSGDADETMGRMPYPTRSPSAQMTHMGKNAGPILLQKGISARNSLTKQSIMSATIDNRIREWDPLSGQLLTEHKIRCGNKMSCFKTFTVDECLTNDKHYAGEKLGGTITAAWDGTIRIRQLFKG